MTSNTYSWRNVKGFGLLQDSRRIFSSQCLYIYMTPDTRERKLTSILFRLATALLFAAYAYPNGRSFGPVMELIGRGQLKGFKAFGAVLGIIQFALQWIFSIILSIIYPHFYLQLLTHLLRVILYARYPDNREAIISTSPMTTITTTISSSTGTRVQVSVSTFVHAALFLFPAIAIAWPKSSRSPPDMAQDIFAGFLLIFNTWISLVFVTLRFFPQYRALRRQFGDPDALSLLSLGTQGLVLILVAVRWFQRLGTPRWGHGTIPFTLWFQWGWLPFTYIVDGIGSFILLGMYLKASRRQEDVVGEQSPLLG